MFKLLVFLLTGLASWGQITSIPNSGGGSTASVGYSASVTAQTTTTVTGATHGQGTTPVAACFDNASPAVATSCSYTRNGSGDIVFTWSPAFTGTVNIFAGGGTAGVSGGSNLTTVGAIPYVSSSGVLNQDAELSYTVGTNTLNLVNATGIAGYGLSFTGAANQAVNFVASGASGYLQFGANGGNVFRVQPSGNTTFGGTTDDNYKLDIQASGSTGTLKVMDTTATTGTTLAVIQAGAGQSGALSSWRNNAGGELVFI